MEEVRVGMSIINLSTDWLEWMEVETDDHREMDIMTEYWNKRRLEAQMTTGRWT